MSSEGYPGPVSLRPFLKSYSEQDIFPITCFSSTNALEGLEMDEEDGVVVVNYKGLAIVTYRSVVTYESTLFGSSYRGYLILFQFTVLDGPSASVLQLSPPVSLCDYTPEHMVRIKIRHLI